MIASEVRRLLAAVAVAGLTFARTAHADESTKIVAEELFNAGRSLLDAGQVDAACPKLAESQRLDPAGGTALLLGLCLERQGRFASAWAALHSARAIADRDGRQDRIVVAEEHLRAVEPRLAHVVVHVAPGADRPELHVTLDGVELGAASRDTSLPIDPGPHELRATAPGYAPFSLTITIPTDAVVTQAAIGPLVLAPHATVAPPSDHPAPPPAPASSRTVPLLATGGVGVVALGFATVYGLMAIDARNREPTTCAAGDAACQNLRTSSTQDRSTDAIVATVAGAVAVGAAGTAAVLLLLPRPAASREQAWTVAPFGLAGAALTGRF